VRREASSSPPSARSRPTPPSPTKRKRDAGKTFWLADLLHLHPMMSTTAQRTTSSTSSAKASAAPSAWSCWSAPSQ
jgi:hypothetical protein